MQLEDFLQKAKRVSHEYNAYLIKFQQNSSHSEPLIATSTLVLYFILSSMLRTWSSKNRIQEIEADC